MAIGSGICVRSIREREIDHELARGADDNETPTPEKSPHKAEGIFQLLSDQNLLFFMSAVVLFHFANAAMLPLVGQRLAQGKSVDPTVYMSACVIVAQLVMIPSANITGWLATNARKPIFLVGFGILSIRGVLYTLSNNPYFLVSVQILDGIAGGIFGVLSVLMIADLTRGTGRFNVTQGLLNTAIGIGAGLSNLIAGFVVKKTGYNSAFLMLGAVFWFLVPETKLKSSQMPSEVV